MVTYREFVKENYPKLPAGMKATEKITKIASMWRASGHSKKRATKVKGGNLTPGTVLTHSLGEGLNRGRGRPRKVKGGSESLEEHMIACGLGKDKLVSKITTKLEGGELDSDSDSEQAGLVALRAARTKNQEKVSDATNNIAEACSNCHEVYRDKGPADSQARCTPPPKK